MGSASWPLISKPRNNLTGKIPPNDLKGIKQMLLSGDKRQILLSIENVQLLMSFRENLSDLISSDISEFLCDAMIPFDEVICSGVCKCLNTFSEHEDFFVQKHACYVVEALIRSLYFILKTSTKYSNLYDCLGVIECITRGYTRHDSIPEKETVENLFQLLSNLLKNGTLTVKNKYQIGCVFLNLTRLSSSVVWSECSDVNVLLTTAECFTLWIDVIDEVFYLDHPLKENLIFLCATLSYFMLNVIIYKLDSFNDISDARGPVTNDLASKLCNFLINFETPYLNTLSLSAIRYEPKKAEIFFQILLCFFENDKLPLRTYLAHGLTELGFLQFVTKLISFADFRNCEQLRRLGVSALSHVVVELSEDVFQVSQIRPNEGRDLRLELQKGFSQLPLDASQWLDLLPDSDACFTCKTALLLYLYFYCMTAESQSILATIYSPMVSFMDCASEVASSTLLVKVVWFVCVISQLSYNQNRWIENDRDEQATDKIVFMLERLNNLDVVYTHHPALLYWAFSFEINSAIQYKIVHLWLRNRSPDCRELENLIEKSSEVRFVMLDILQNERGEVLDSAFSTLHSVLVETGNDDLTSCVWFLLPQMLSKCTANLAAAKNLDYAIELCSLKMPENLDASRAMRIAGLLPEILMKSDLLSVVPALTLSHRLLELSIRTGDRRILKVFFRMDTFILKIIDGINSDVSDIALLSLRILTLLWKNSSKCCGDETKGKISIAKETVLKTFSFEPIQILQASLNFLVEILTTGFRSEMFEIVQLDSEFVEILFFEVENICIKVFQDVPSLSTASWSCLKLFLSLHVSSGEFRHLRFAWDPLLHEIVDFHLPSAHASAELSKEMREFLMVWFREMNSNFPTKESFGKKIFGKYFEATARKISEHLERNFSEDDASLYEKVLEIFPRE